MPHHVPKDADGTLVLCSQFDLRVCHGRPTFLAQHVSRIATKDRDKPREEYPCTIDHIHCMFSMFPNLTALEIDTTAELLDALDRVDPQLQWPDRVREAALLNPGQFFEAAAAEFQHRLLRRLPAQICGGSRSP